MNETILEKSGMQVLIDKFGNVDAERFISLIIKEPFNYTKWQENLYEDMSIEELSKRAMEFKNIKVLSRFKKISLSFEISLTILPEYYQQFKLFILA